VRPVELVAILEDVVREVGNDIRSDASKAAMNPPIPLCREGIHGGGGPAGGGPTLGVRATATGMR